MQMAGRRGLVALMLTLTFVVLVERSAPTQDIDANAALFERYVEALRRIAHVPGISAVILRDGRAVWQRGFGFANVDARVPATPDTLYDIASLTKTFTSTLLLQCVERGTLSLDEPIARYSPTIAEPGATVRHVLTHTSQGTPGVAYRYDGNRYAALTSVVEACHARPFRQALALSILDRAVQSLGKFLGAEESHRPGGQHEMDSRYLERVEALNFAIQHDDGQNQPNLADAEVILVGVSRSSKTPTCIYLAIRGVRAGNIPIVPGVEIPEHLFALKKPLFVGLWLTPERLLQIRRNRLTTIGETKSSTYVDEEAVRAEIAFTRRLFERYEWPTIDVSRRSIEETAASILNLLAEREAAA